MHALPLPATISKRRFHAQLYDQANYQTLFIGTFDFGSWTGPGPGQNRLQRYLEIEHRQERFRSHATARGMQGDMTYDVSYTTDGKECVNHVADNEFKSTLKWDGDELVVDTKGSFGGNDFTSKDRWTLSADGKTLTRAQHVSSAMGEADMKMVFEKQ